MATGIIEIENRKKVLGLSIKWVGHRSLAFNLDLMYAAFAKTSRQEISGPVPVWQRGEGEVLLLKSREAHGVGFWIRRTEQVLLMKTALHSNSAHRDNFPGKFL